MTIVVVAVSYFAFSVIAGLVFARLFAFTERPVRPAVVAAARRGQRQRDDQ